jgi:site-specific recombinase XerD
VFVRSVIFSSLFRNKTPDGVTYSSIFWALLQDAPKGAKLRHARGYALANKGHDTRAIQGWLGHRSITSTAVYTALAPNRFKDFWRD